MQVKKECCLKREENTKKSCKKNEEGKGKQMRNKMNRFLSIVLALVMVLSSAVPVFPEDTTDAAAQNMTTNVLYEDISAALSEAKANETVMILQDISTMLVTVPEYITLDLNGHEVEATYVTCFGNIVDQDADNAGLLKVASEQFLIQNSNTQLPVKDSEGYRFFEIEKYNTKYLKDNSQYAFQPFIEASAHSLFLQGAAVSGATVNVRLSWTQADGVRSQDFVYSDDFVSKYINSYRANNTYGKMFSLMLNGTEGFENLTFSAVVASDTGVEIASESIVLNPTEDEETGNVVTDDNNQVVEDVTLQNEQGSAVVATGTQLNENATQLTLTAEEMSATTSNITLGEGEQMLSMNVHVEGVAANNTVPVLVTLDEIAPEYLNQGNISLYHVENGQTVEMTRVYSLEEVDEHNEYYYDILTGTITMALATFSEVAVVADEANAWNGEFDYSWYTNAVAVAEGESTAEYSIANADQLAAFGAIVGGMNGQTRDSFTGDIVKLLADIDLGDAEDKNNPDMIFYPIGYNNSTGKYVKTSDIGVISDVNSFEGTFDGNGHTIKNFYQNTWEMFGGYNDDYPAGSNHYNDAMGLFGYVLNGTIKNLTVHNFESDGEYAPTGVIAAYAVNSTFENIAITNCNPRVYNTGNGGIVGIGGNSDDTDAKKLTFNNITVDNTNVITALWGSWDVACGGLVGMFRGAGSVDMTNCHVAAQMDVFNDVCGNYQYYWYRYSGMLIGTNKTMVENNGRTVPDTSKFTTNNCTVHFGDWNDYYYCELVANSIASYTHDHQFSRLTEVTAVDTVNMTVTVGEKTTAIPTSGKYNYVVVDGEEATENATCYHFVDGKVWNHADAGEETVDVDGDGVKETVLKEDRQHYYLPFNQLVTGYGWGVQHVPITGDSSESKISYAEDCFAKGITILGRESQKSVEKFKSLGTTEFANNTEISIGEIFEAVSGYEDDIKSQNVQVTVSNVINGVQASDVSAVYTPNSSDWKQGTLVFSGNDQATVTITDYYFCTPTTITVKVSDKQPMSKFEVAFDHDAEEKGNQNNLDKYLYRVGNQNAVKLSSLFEAVESAEIGTVEVTVDGTAASGIYTSNSTWTNGTIKFAGTGIVKVTITDNNYCKPCELYLEVIDAKNITKAESATANNVVLLNDISGGFSVSTGYGFYGNGFTITLDPNNHSTKKGNGYAGYIHMNGGTIDNVQIVGPVFAESNIYQSQALHNGTGADDPADYFRNGICIDSGDAVIINSYISGARVPVLVKAGNNVTIQNTHISGGAYANVEIIATKSLTLRNVITEQKEAKDSYGNSKDVIGLGIVFNTADAKLILDGVTQYNWITNDQWSGMLGSYESSFPALFSNEKYKNLRYTSTDGETRVVNTGIIYACDVTAPNIEGEIAGYKQMEVTAGGKQGIVYTKANENAYEQLKDSDINAPIYEADTQNAVPPTVIFDYTTKNNEPEQNGSNDYCYYNTTSGKYLISFDQGDSKEWYYDILTVKKGNKNISYSVSVSDGAVINENNNTITFGEAGNYTVTYTYEDEYNYELANGEITSYITSYSEEIYITVFEVEPEVEPTTFAFGDNGYKTVSVDGKTYVMPNVSATIDPKADDNGVLETSGIGSKTIGGETVYYPIIAQHKVGKSTGYYNYFSVFEAVIIKDADGTTQYDVKTTDMPNNLMVIGGFIDAGAESENGTAIFNYSTGKTIKIKTVTTKSGNNLGLCYYPDSAFSSGTTARPKQTIVVKYQYTDTNGKVYYYYIGYLCAKGNSGREDEESDGCVTADTLITLSDGSQVRVDSLTGNEELLVWNLETGSLDSAPLMFVDSDPEEEYEIIHLYFSDGTDVKVIYEHGFWDYDLNKYVYLDRDAEKYIGHLFAKQNGDELEKVILTDVVIEREVTTAWSPVTEDHLCYFVNGMLSMPGGVGGLFNIFDVDAETMAYDYEAMAQDIETYGLFTYEELNSIVPLSEEMFNAAGGAYLKVSIGKGNLTMDELIYMIQRYSKYFE